MKKLITLLLLFVGMVSTASATEITVYFMVNGNFKAASAKFAFIAQQQGTDNQTWGTFEEIKTNVYRASFTYNAYFDEFYLFRMPSDYSGGKPWDTKWNVSSKLTVPSVNTYYSAPANVADDFSCTSTTDIPDFNGYYLISNVDTWSRGSKFTEVSSGTYECSFSGITYAEKLISWAPGYAFNAENKVEQWGTVLRPNTNDNNNHWINFANYTYGTLYTATGANKSVWYLPHTGTDDQKTNEGEVTISYIPGSNSATITCAKSLTIGSAGYATYSNDEKFTVSGATAYTAKDMGTYAKLFAIDPGTVFPGGDMGLLLRGSGEVTINAVASDASTATYTSNYASNNNLLGSGNSGASIDEGCFVLFWDGINTSSVCFRKTTSGDLAAHKAYLPAGSLAREFLSFEEGETTGIETVKASQKMNGEFFNLAGQRVAQPAKGLYIVNGKKVIMK